MPATPNYALPYPAAADPADVPLDMQELADRLELVLPTAKILYAAHEGSEALGSTSWADFPTVGPSITVPSAGDYLVSWGAHLSGTVTGGSAFAWYLGVAVGATPPTDADAAFFRGTGGGAFPDGATVERSSRRTLSAGAALKLMYRITFGGNVQQRWITAQRLSA